jgi:hypothetical protein
MAGPSFDFRLDPVTLGFRIEKGIVAVRPPAPTPRRGKNAGRGGIPSGFLAEFADREELVQVLAILGLV